MKNFESKKQCLISFFSFFKNKKMKKEDQIKLSYESEKKEINRKINGISERCVENINEKRDYMFELTGDWNIFTFSDDEINKGFEATLAAYEKSLIKYYILPHYGNYEWCKEKNM